MISHLFTASLLKPMLGFVFETQGGFVVDPLPVLGLLEKSVSALCDITEGVILFQRSRAMTGDRALTGEVKTLLKLIVYIIGLSHSCTLSETVVGVSSFCTIDLSGSGCPGLPWQPL